MRREERERGEVPESRRERRNIRRRIEEDEIPEESVRQGKRARRIKERNDKRGNRQIVVVAYVCVLVFLGMIGYLVHFMVSDSQQIINNSYNKRQELLAQKVIRGEILSADGKVLAQTVTDGDGKEVREYPYEEMFCHVVGRTANSMTGIEGAQSFPLLTSHSNPFKQLVNEFQGEKSQGDSVVTTLDFELQQVAYQVLGNHKGAVVAMEPSTGKILAMVSKPDYDPNTVLEEWDRLLEDSEEKSALLNRATQGLYPPGSTFKILTALEYMQEKASYKKYHYDCKGKIISQGNSISCYNHEQHGAVNLRQSLAKSCNGSFANIGMMLDIDSFRELCERFQFNKKLGVNFEYNPSQFSLNKDSSVGEVMQTSIGQGKTMITPLQNALISAAIANDGVMMTPYLVDYVKNDVNRKVTEYKPKKEAEVISKEEANRITKMMKAVINEGTASSLKYLSYPVAGKTGTAEYDSAGNSHAWFVGFAPAGKPKIVISVIVEEAGTGSQYAVPIAKQMLQQYLGD